MSRPGTVLHIDDDADTRLLVRELAHEQAFGGSDRRIRWLEASGVAEALRRYGGQPVDLILLDQRLGPESGAEALSRLKAAWGCPIWLLTGLRPEALPAPNGLLEAAGVISKDQLLFDASALRRILEPALAPAGPEVLNSKGGRSRMPP